MIHPVLYEQELLRYLEYFQKALVREGSGNFLAEQKLWFQQNRDRLAAEYDGIVTTCGKAVDALGNPVLLYQDQTQYDSFFTHQIFSPILLAALAASERLGYPIRKPVILANAPSMEPSPAGVPSTDSHMLFIGQGTYAFCNYWAKIFSGAIYRVGSIPSQDRTIETAMAAICSDPIMLQALKLVLRYARAESLVGFGEIAEDPKLSHFRILLVAAMEAFVVGHELGHFFLHEKYPESNGVPPGHSQKEVELLCDAMGFAICAAVGGAESNDVSKNLIGPLLLLYVLRLCEDVQSLLMSVKPETSDTHPTLTERIQSLFRFSVATDPSGSLASSLKETLDCASIIGAHIKSVLGALERLSSDDFPRK